MNRYIYFILLIALISFNCGRQRQVVPYEFDAEEALKPLSPNEDEDPQNITFGREHIPGITFDYEITTEKNDVYVYFQNITLLEVNPLVGDSIFNFVNQQLVDFGFLNDTISVSKNEYSNLLSQAVSFKEASEKILDNIKVDFQAQLDTIYSYECPFNIYFQVYPVYLDNKFVTFKQSAYAYTGGAHGINVIQLETYDIKTGQKIGFSDIVKPEYQSLVREEVASRMAYAYPIYENITTVSQYIDSLNVFLDNNDSEEDENSDKITAENFPISDVAVIEGGLLFVYQMYELTPGSDGCPMVFIPFSDLKGYLLI